MAALAAVSVIGCTTPVKDVPLSEGTYKASVPVRFQGRNRTVRLHIPRNYGANADPVPLVVVIHGAFSTARKAEARSGFSRLSDDHGFIVAYPNGIGIAGLLQHWNAGHCCGKAAKDGIDDTGFLETVIEHVRTRFRIDRKRVYLVGFSNGGMLAYAFAVERPDGVAAIAVVAGAMASGTSPEFTIRKPTGSVPLIVFHGESDGNVPYRGGPDWNKGDRFYCSVDQSVGAWMVGNGCAGRPSETLDRAGHVRVERWKSTSGNDVVLYSLKGWGHYWPTASETDSLPEDHPLHGFDAGPVIWKFFKAHEKGVRILGR